MARALEPPSKLSRPQRYGDNPLLEHVCGRLPLTGADPASQPIFSRLENASTARTCCPLAVARGAVYVRERERAGVPTQSPSAKSQSSGKWDGGNGQSILVTRAMQGSLKDT